MAVAAVPGRGDEAPPALRRGLGLQDPQALDVPGLPRPGEVVRRRVGADLLLQREHALDEVVGCGPLPGHDLVRRRARLRLGPQGRPAGPVLRGEVDGAQHVLADAAGADHAGERRARSVGVDGLEVAPEHEPGAARGAQAVGGVVEQSAAESLAASARDDVQVDLAEVGVLRERERQAAPADDRAVLPERPDLLPLRCVAHAGVGEHVRPGVARQARDVVLLGCRTGLVPGAEQGLIEVAGARGELEVRLHRHRRHGIDGGRVAAVRQAVFPPPRGQSTGR